MWLIEWSNTWQSEGATTSIKSHIYDLHYDYIKMK
jgi:hypothetical protein